ncbi:FAD-binding protein [Streptomyces sp. NBC_00083]|uniref:FAD-binding protein n=1 Tax=Streptomyces sp. NBC_00083 TaxID=2975647 RepID=UPI002255CFCE|nr:FAD-binding protein [Streptomyces sp. NBC_00083]MCX5388141.1 FAD-binding protein [Streptomyces sp. NBC_00083]
MTRVIVLGAGGAGLTAAIEAASGGADVVLVTKAIYQNTSYRWASVGGCTWKTHAFNAAVAEGDSVAAHVRDTLVGGAHANDPALAQVLCEGSRELVYWLEGIGLAFERDAADGFATRPFGGCGTPRGVYLEDRLGYHIQRALDVELARLVAEGRVTVLSGLRGTRLLLDAYGEVRGLEAVAVDSLQLLEVPGDAVILADGGGASMYAPTAASMDKTCDGLALGLESGAEAVDMEFVQFHPTGLVSDVLTFDGSLVEEAIRFDGAVLLNRHGERFMLGHDERGERATRDVVSRGIYRELVEGRAFDDGSVHLDISACRQVIPDRYPALDERLVQAGADPRHANTLSVRPTAHFLMGGLRIGPRAGTTVPGLYAAGESAGGVHGANRLGGNGLSEALVFGRIAGRDAAATRAGHASTDIRVTGAFRAPTGGGESVDGVLQSLRQGMYRTAGPIRTGRGLTTMLGLISVLEERSRSIGLATGSRAAGQVQTYLDLKNLLLASETIVEAALRREESRGSHYRDDFPHRAAEFEGSTAVLKEGRLAWSPYRHAVAEAAVPC